MPMTTPDDDQAPAAGELRTRRAASSSRRRLLVAGAVIAVIVLIGAGALVWHLWRRPVPEPFSHTPVIPVALPDPALANNPVVAAVAPSVVKVRVYASANPFDATVVSYDPSVDIAILAVPNLPPQPLTFDQTEAKWGENVVVLGYPGGGNFTATPARIRQAIKLSFPDIYHDPTPVTRDVYTIRANVEQGNTGGPLIDLNGRVLGVVYGTAVDDADTAFVLTSGDVASQLSKIGGTQPVQTGACAS